MSRLPGVLIPALGVLAVVAHHLAWFDSFPQYLTYPPDQAGYLAGGRILISAFSTLMVEGFRAGTLEEIRRWFDFFGVALVYGAIDVFRPNDLFFTRWVFTFFNAAAALGAYSLARRLSTPMAGAVALAMFAVSPAFPSGASRLYPDAITGCLIVWSLRLFVARGRGAIAAGVLAGAAMLIRVQLLPWIPLGLFGLTLLAWIVVRVEPDTRARIRQGWIGLSLPLVLFAGLTHFGLENRHDSAPKHNLPRYHYYAYGVWQYLESDGWEGPWRLKQDPFYLAMVKESADDPGLLTSRPRQYLFAARYTAARLDKAVPIILGNFFRIFDRPQNPEHRGFIPPRSAIAIHRLGLVCALVAAVRLWSLGSPGLLAPLLILILGAFHAMAWGWPRYLMPVLPTLLALSGMGFVILLDALRARPRLGLWILFVVAAAFGAATLVRESSPEAAWGFRVAAMAMVFCGPVLVAHPGSESLSRRAALAVAIVVSVVIVGDAWRDRAWHTVEFQLEPGDVIRQEISLDAEGHKRLQEAHERYLGVDLELKDPSHSPWAVTINGRAARLEPGIPRLPESIPLETDSRGYPQWWLTPLTDDMLGSAKEQGRLVVELRIDNPNLARLKGDRFREQDRVFEAPSLGDWPHAAGIKPEYDREYRLVHTTVLASLGSRTFLVRAGALSPLTAQARIRVFELDDRSGWTAIEARKLTPVPGERTLLGFAARAAMKDRGPAELLVGGIKAVPFRIAMFTNTIWTAGDFQLCYRDRTPNQDDAYLSRGIYLLSGPIPCSANTCEVKVRFWPGMDDRPMTFGPELPKNQPGALELQEVARDCGFVGTVGWGFGRLIDGSANEYPADRGRWRVARIY